MNFQCRSFRTCCSQKNESVHPNVFAPKPSDRQSRHTRDSPWATRATTKAAIKAKFRANSPEHRKMSTTQMLAKPHILDNELSVLLFPNMMSSKSASGHPNVFWPHLLIANHHILMIARRATRATTKATLKAQYQDWDRMSTWYSASKMMVLLKRNHHFHLPCIPKDHQQAVKTIETFALQV